MRSALSLVAAVLLVSCSSSAPTANKGGENEPAARIAQTSRLPDIAAHQSGAISVSFQVDVSNRARGNIRVKRVDLQSVGQGVYSLPLLSKPFALDLKPGESGSVELSGPAYMIDPTTISAQGPVVIRLTLYYDAPGGPQQTVLIQQVNPGLN